MDWFGRPATKVLSNNTVVMVYRRATEHASSDGVMHIRFSDDYGATWTDEDTDLNGDPVAGFPLFLDPSPGGGVSNCWLIRRDDDALLLLFDYVDWSGPTFYGMYQCVGSADGLTWGTPTQVVIAGMDDSLLCLAECDDFYYNGRLYTTVGVKPSPSSPAHCALVYSDDDGATWTKLSTVATSANEGGIEFVGDNTIRALIRSASQIHTYYNVSADMGASWEGQFELTYRISPIGRPHIMTRTHLQGGANWWTDPYLVAWGFVFRDGGRYNALFLSKDAGQTWTSEMVVDDVYSDAGYGDMFYNPNTGEYVFMCYRGTSFKADLVQYNIAINWGT